MPIRRGAVNLARFRLQTKVPKDVKRWLQRGLTKGAFEPIDVKGDDERAAGFVELEAPARREFSAGSLFYGQHALFAWRVDTLRVATPAVRAALLQWSQAYEKKNGRAPGRRERSEQKDLIRKGLRAKQEPVTKVFEISLDLSTYDFFIWATSRNVVDEVQAAFEANVETKLQARVPAAFLDPAVLDALKPTPALFGETA